MMIELGEAVEYLHKENWIHRDICPRNVLVDKEHSHQADRLRPRGPQHGRLPRTGQPHGTANYMAPELIKRQRTDQRIDIFSFAVTCYRNVLPRSFPGPSITGRASKWCSSGSTQGRRTSRTVVQLDTQIAATIIEGLEADPARVAGKR